ncbi:serine hydrolase [Sediminibacter sp. Hel_I_10]|uniref:serine hydrolase n=1 Tax=Sediminibacter sp. Hel_I_10 TaxID=1392490 RepID=UPI00056D93B3|nr:serine hydrolase [Sediminibacter sp. Hel_I_10]
MTDQSLAERLKYQRKSKGLSQEELALKTNVTVRTIQRIEKSETNPHLNTIKLLAAALDVEVSDLLPLCNPKEENIKKKWLLLLHAIPLLGIFIPLCNVLLPLFVWIHKREDNPIYDHQGIKVINFQITALLLVLLSFVSLMTIEKWGFIIFIATVPICICIVIFNIIYVIKKEKCFYPLSIPFLRYKPSSALKGLLILMGVFTLNSCAPKSDNLVTRIDGSTIIKDSISHKIDHLVEQGQVQGSSLAIFSNNQQVYQHSVGYKDVQKQLKLTDSTNMYGASLSKAVFSIIVMKLVEDQVIELDTPLESYLPKKIHEYEPLTRWHDDYSDLKNDTLYSQITARMCLNHTSGFQNWRSQDQKLQVFTAPGEIYNYSGEGFVYLQVVLEKLTGKGLEQLAREIIFEPLGMQNSSYEWKDRFENDFAISYAKNGGIYNKDKDNEPRAASTLETTFEDYIRFLGAVLNKEIISKKSYRQMFSPQTEIKPLSQIIDDVHAQADTYKDIELGYGLGWGYLKTPNGVGYFKEGRGSGFHHYSIIFPEKGYGVLIMSNSENTASIYKELLEYTTSNSHMPWEWFREIPYK